ncbi:hypothetical protein CANTEDRAFT_113736 [Yamadazyma tenuis ATCC 10573]|uniref:Uncharacterized protein n=1 Tax=Candida tenuis (strain ATCC 10573 / BCRC 21748 / CBS 615 / JCM 9827 / NBRC 10315 / NRRL Y-1498 / VKM Y-70) TaxID=590646 RepID=G3B2Y4_CANTC|nr:uncharacterized protein CANTEDRAFT_113736 [Yamadazyma tenuis ATCC 10573]EGV64449.1 hypothetical protein CANTEDRAFT_113736 [Yamadazyma tenuis ATCC 10573]
MVRTLVEGAGIEGARLKGEATSEGAPVEDGVLEDEIEVFEFNQKDRLDEVVLPGGVVDEIMVVVVLSISLVIVASL